jgi:hypothetical protein
VCSPTPTFDGEVCLARTVYMVSTDNVGGLPPHPRRALKMDGTQPAHHSAAQVKAKATKRELTMRLL